MKRLHVKTDKRQENSMIDAFLKEIHRVCVKHAMTIAHEDTGGAFVIEKFKEENIEWLQDAQDNT